MDRPEAPSADTAILVYLVAATSVAAGLGFIFFTVVMAPTVIASTPHPPRKAIQSAVLLDPTGFKATVDSERLAVAKANEMNGQPGLKIAKHVEQPASAFAEMLHKQKRVPQARRTASIARATPDAGRKLKLPEPQPFSVSWW